MPQGSPGQGFGVSDVGNAFFMQPATAVAIEMNATASDEPSPGRVRTPRAKFVEATEPPSPLSTRTAEVALPAARAGATTCRPGR